MRTKIVLCVSNQILTPRKTISLLTQMARTIKMITTGLNFLMKRIRFCHMKLIIKKNWKSNWWMLKIGLNNYKKMKKGKIILAIKSNRKLMNLIMILTMMKTTFYYNPVTTIISVTNLNKMKKSKNYLLFINKRIIILPKNSQNKIVSNKM